MDRDPTAVPAASIAWKRDVDGTGRRIEHVPEGSRAPVAHDCFISKREQRGHAPPLEAQPGMADSVNTAMEVMKASGFRPLGDSLVAEPGVA